MSTNSLGENKNLPLCYLDYCIHPGEDKASCVKIGALPPKVVKLIFLGDLLVRNISLTISGESAPTNITASPQSYLKLKLL